MPSGYRKSFEKSICFGLYEHCDGITDQVGFARIVTDGATFSWLCDVVIDEEYRGRGLGKFLMGEIVKHPAVANTVCLLRTDNAHDLYDRFGFGQCGAMMRKPKGGR